MPGAGVRDANCADRLPRRVGGRVARLNVPRPVAGQEFVAVGGGVRSREVTEGGGVRSL